MTLRKRLQEWTTGLGEKPGLMVLIGMLVVIIFTSIQPGQYFIGWDNYSSFFNLETNIFRTLFSSWRAYRGIGVSSDSEVVDIFRQLFFFMVSPVVSEPLLDQVYIYMSLILGTIGMYMLMWQIIPRSLKSERMRDGVAFVAAFFYLFNLNTLGTFTFPIITFITRFGSLPILFLVLYRYVRKAMTTRALIFTVLVFAYSAGSFITATVFITTLLALGVSVLLMDKKKRTRGVQFLLFFVGFNLFWLVPFVNYTIEKADSIRLAPIFIDTNETLLNLPRDTTSYTTQLSLTPYSFDAVFRDALTDAALPFHPLTNMLSHTGYTAVVMVFPVLYLLGSGWLLLRRKRTEGTIAVLTLLFVFLSLKEHSPLGYVYHLLDIYVPYFGVIFRFGDTKFHTYVAFFGSIAIGLMVQAVFTALSGNMRKLLMVVVVALVVPTVLVYRSYFSGSFLPAYMFNELPDAYRHITQTINEDPREGRVLHLPYDTSAYWKSYSWGPLGSSFLHFMLDKPLIDRTFEPASLEMSWVYERLSQILNDVQQLSDDEHRIDRALELYEFLSALGVRYVIMDETVSAEVPSRNARYWGQFNRFESEALLTQLEHMGHIERVQTHRVNVNAYINAYPKETALSTEQLDLLERVGEQEVVLYALTDIEPAVSLVGGDVSYVDTGIDHAFVALRRPEAGVYIQSEGIPGSRYPLVERTHEITIHDDGIALALTNGHDDRYTSRFDDTLIAASDDGRYLVEATVYRDGTDAVVQLDQVHMPSVSERIHEIRIPLAELGSVPDDVSADAYVSNWHVLGHDSYGTRRLRVGDSVVPFPATIDETALSIGTFLVSSDSASVDILIPSSVETLDHASFVLTDEPNCFQDQQEGYDYAYEVRDAVQLSTQAGSPCVIAPLTTAIRPETAYAELGLTIAGKATTADADEDIALLHPGIRDAVASLPYPNRLNVCVREGNIDTCYNTHQLLQIPSEEEPVLFPIEHDLSGIQHVNVLIGLTTVGGQQQELTLRNPVLRTYRAVSEPFVLAPQAYDAREHGKEDVVLPYVMSPYAYYFNPTRDALFASTEQCGTDAYRTSRQLDGALVDIVVNCDNVLSHNTRFDGSVFSLWMMEYQLLSGAFPRFVLEDTFAHYVGEYASRFQGYPAIDGFQRYQFPEFIVPRLTRDAVLAQLMHGPYQRAYTYVSPQPDVGDLREKHYAIAHYSGNAGMYALRDFMVLPLPSSWQGYAWEPATPTVDTYTSDAISYERTLPSLVRVVMSDGRSEASLLYFNESYDRQWRAYPSLMAVVSGGIAPQRCNGYANCFTIPADWEQVVLLYDPEKLSLLGWILTFATVFFSAFSLRRVRPRRVS